MEKIKILVCDIDQTNLNLLQELIINQNINSEIYLSDPNNFLKFVQFHNPHLVITDNRFWCFHDGNCTIKQLRKNYSTPVIIWANKSNDKIISPDLFSVSNVYYLNGTNGITDLIKSISSARTKHFNGITNLVNRFNRAKIFFKSLQTAS